LHSHSPEEKKEGNIKVKKGRQRKKYNGETRRIGRTKLERKKRNIDKTEGKMLRRKESKKTY
jgi:hypothetical protein